MKKLIPWYCSALLFISTGNLSGQLAVESSSKIPGISTDRLERYDTFLQKEINEGRLPGAVSYIVRKGEVVHKAAYGYSSLKDKASMREDQILHIMSMTKPIVTVGFMMLYEEGHFFLTDPVSKYLPQFKDLRVATDVTKGLDQTTEPANKEITIHQILTHTAGFSHGLGGNELDNAIAKALYYEPQENIEDRVNTLVTLPMIGQPGEQWYYSASPDVLSLLIEHFSGISTAEFLQQRIFGPLGMNDTGYNIDKKDQARWGPVHNINEEGKMVVSEDQLPIEGNTVFGGTHGLFSTAADYMLFCRMLLNGGSWNGIRFLSPKTLDIMTMNQVGALYQAPGQGFGLGFGVTTDVANSKSLGSKGQYYWSGAYCTYFFIDPQEELIAILMTQVQPYNNYYGSILRQFVYQSLTD
ncbi:beta-lactamase family protein [Flavobacteriaceae bacterium TP-CH-4]|uniref:Beta-lactamase family protein n=1 Tax=Pelagihabitans pacificus TaxID=2696054 RepID=A0A967AY16_9FLAO|nr:serine hydrolase domain-containing protein [Pelagihabitans pacificus]NHF61258.1 beta-lactamase family protein [Pelagihabitans pacificus]